MRTPSYIHQWTKSKLPSESSKLALAYADMQTVHSRISWRILLQSSPYRQTQRYRITPLRRSPHKGHFPTESTCLILIPISSPPKPLHVAVPKLGIVPRYPWWVKEPTKESAPAEVIYQTSRYLNHWNLLRKRCHNGRKESRDDAPGSRTRPVKFQERTRRWRKTRCDDCVAGTEGFDHFEGQRGEPGPGQGDMVGEDAVLPVNYRVFRRAGEHLEVSLLMPTERRGWVCIFTLMTQQWARFIEIVRIIQYTHLYF